MDTGVGGGQSPPLPPWIHCCPPVQMPSSQSIFWQKLLLFEGNLLLFFIKCYYETINLFWIAVIFRHFKWYIYVKCHFEVIMESTVEEGRGFMTYIWNPFNSFIILINLIYTFNGGFWAFIQTLQRQKQFQPILSV